MQPPGTALALVLGALRFHLTLHVSWIAVPAILLVALTGAAVGYAMAAALPPQVTGQAGSFISIGILLFSPINFPADRLPWALHAVHRVLPVQYMADLVRGSLTGQYADPRLLAFAVVAAWCSVGLFVSFRTATRRL